MGETAVQQDCFVRAYVVTSAQAVLGGHLLLFVDVCVFVTLSEPAFTLPIAVVLRSSVEHRDWKVEA